LHAAAWGDVEIASVFTDHMVLQRDKPVPSGARPTRENRLRSRLPGRCAGVRHQELAWRQGGRNRIEENLAALAFPVFSQGPNSIVILADDMDN